LVTGEATILSVLVPTYNYADYIVGAVRSVLDQNVAGVEIVVADDGSTDETEEVLRPWIATGEVRYVRQSNRGPAAARNLALAHARGSLLMLLDADDALIPGCLATTIDFMERHTDVGLFFTNYDIFDETGVLIPSGVDIWGVFRRIPHREVEREEWMFTEALTSYIIRYGAFMHTSGLTFRRNVADRAGPFREGFCYAEDDEFYARVAHLCTAGYVDRVLSRKRNHPRSIIHDDANTLRNANHLLELTEIQLGYYERDAELQEILKKKLRDCAKGYAWRLINQEHLAEAWACLTKYLTRYPFHWPFYRLLGKVALLRIRPGREP
jgi:glycosyltransferase involved in cell wall biosynthesis